MKRILSLLLIATIVTSGFTIGFLENEVFGYENKKRKSVYDSQSDSKLQLNKYYNYVHLQPEWNSYPSNIIFDVSTFWNRTDIGATK